MSSIEPIHRERIRRNYAGGDLSCGELLYLLEHLVASGSEGPAEALVELLAAVRHCNLRAHAPHSTSRGVLHYTVFVAGRGYHLRQVPDGVHFRVAAGELDPPFLRGVIGEAEDGPEAVGLRAAH